MVQVTSLRSVDSLEEAERLINSVECDPASIPIMAPKAVFKIIQMDDVILQDAIIIKQDMLSIGGEVAIPKHSFDLKQDPGTILLMGTLAQFTELVNKLNRHYPRIKKIAKELDRFIQKNH